MPATVQDVVKKLTIVHSFPGADEAKAKIKSLADAQREVGKASIETQTATKSAESSIIGMVRSYGAANDNLRRLADGGIRLVGQSAAQTVRTIGELGAVATQVAAPAIGTIANEALRAGGIMGRELVPAVLEAGKALLPLAAAVAMALQRRAEPRRVVHYTGEGKGLQVNFYDTPKHDSSRELLAEYVPAGTPVGTPLSGTA